MSAITKQEEFIIDESPELSVGENPDWIDKFNEAFPAFKHRNYRLYFGGQLVSLIGTWLQNVAQGWLVLQITHSAFWVGTVTAIGTLPIMFFALFAGVLIDRFPKRKVLMIAQFSAMIFAVTLGLLTIFGVVTLWQIILIAFLLGLVNSIDMPGRQAFAVEMVGKEDLHSAIALNSGIFNGARVIGPAIAGILIASIGTGGAFILNGLSFMGLVVALRMMNVQDKVHEVHSNPFRAIKDGVSYAYHHKLIRTLLLYTSIVSIFGWSYTTIMPVVAEEVFHKDASGLGTLYMVAGLGALIGTVMVSSVSRKMNPIVFIFSGAIIFSISLIAFSFMDNFAASLFFMFFSGLGLIMQFATMNTTIQRSVEDSLRGRVMSLYTLMFLGLSPIGSFQIGLVAQHMGSMFAIRIGAIFILIFSILLFTQRKKLINH